MAEELLSIHDVARLSRLSEKTVRRAIARAELRAHKLCNRVRVRREDYEAWIEQARYQSKVPSGTVPVVPGRTARGSLAVLRGIEVEAN